MYTRAGGPSIKRNVESQKCIVPSRSHLECIVHWKLTMTNSWRRQTMRSAFRSGWQRAGEHNERFAVQLPSVNAMHLHPCSYFFYAQNKPEVRLYRKKKVKIERTLLVSSLKMPTISHMPSRCHIQYQHIYARAHTHTHARRLLKRFSSVFFPLRLRW